MINPKIGQAHLSRRAIVYLRQSTPHQVESNRESTSRQYALAERASELGWDKSLIQILDGDLGKSGQSTTGREDFHKLMAAVGLGEVGAVLALEARVLTLWDKTRKFFMHFSCHKKLPKIEFFVLRALTVQKLDVPILQDRYHEYFPRHS